MPSIVTSLRLGAAVAVIVVATQATIVHRELDATDKARSSSLRTTGVSLRQARLVQSALADALVASDVPDTTFLGDTAAIGDAVDRARANLAGIDADARPRAIDELIVALTGRLDSADLDARALAEAVQASATLANALAADAWRHSSEITSSFDRARRALWAGTVLLLAIAVALAVLIDRQVGRRLSGLAESADALAAGNLSEPIVVTGADEITAVGEPIERLRRLALEIESTAYAAAHDMKSPVFAISQLIDWTLDDHEAAMPAAATENLRRALDRCRGLAELQADLLAYAIAGHEPEPSEPVDVAALARQSHEAMPTSDAFILDVRTVLDAPVLPPVVAARIIDNLVSNSIRHHDCETGSIAVSAWRDGNRVVLEVLDDGPGIPLADHERVQMLFERNRSAGGTGLGLALVKRLAERAGGGLTIRSPTVGGRGTAITVTLGSPAV